MVLTGWKTISAYVSCGTRTVQRWEQMGFPVHRPVPGRRSHVIAKSEEIDQWLQERKSRVTGNGAVDLLSSLAKARKLRRQVRLAREELHLKMAALRKELAEIRAKRRHFF